MLFQLVLVPLILVEEEEKEWLLLEQFARLVDKPLNQEPLLHLVLEQNDQLVGEPLLPVDQETRSNFSRSSSSSPISS